MKKKGIKHYLSIIALCCSICYLLLRIFGVIDRYGKFKPQNFIIANAAEEQSVQLSLSQTLALFGTQIPVSFYDHNSGTTHSLNLNYYGTSLDWLPDDTPEGVTLCIDGWTNITNTNKTTFTGFINRAPFLVYMVHLDNFSYDSQSTISVPFSISLDNITSYSGCFALSHGSVQYQHTISKHDESLWNTSFNGVYMRRSMNSSANSRMSVFVSPNYKKDHYVGEADPTKAIHYSIFPGYADYNISNSGELFSASSVSFDWVCPDGYQYGVLGYDCDCYLLVQCPTITGPVPTTTTRPAQTTRAPYTGDYQVTTAQYTYDLSPLETNQINQINIANENLNYVAGIFDGINIIIQQLDDIYNRMAASGEIAVDLLPGDPVKWYGTDVKQQIDYIIDGHTTATLPDFSNQMSFIGSAYNFLMSETWIAMLGGLSLAVSVACWVLFEGRK